MPTKKYRYYACQYGSIWRLSCKQYVALLEAGMRYGSYNLDALGGQQLKRLPVGVMRETDRHDRFYSWLNDVIVISPLDWRPDDFADEMANHCKRMES